MPPSSFSDICREFASGALQPSDYLEQCLAICDEREPVVRAWVATCHERAREDALASDLRWRQGAPLSRIDGLPIGIKDLISVGGMPTSLGIDGYTGPVSDDSTAVRALREAGAIILGKLSTTELGGGTPSRTTNPWDSARTPGGSSSGSAAAVAAGMVPVSLGTQVGGSILRPAGFCGNVAIKPTQGAFHRGERMGLSHGCIGVHANSLEDMWITATEMGRRCGGDPGYPGLYWTTTTLPEARKPDRLAVMEGPGWEITGAGARAAITGLLARLEAEGITVLRPGDDADFDTFHQLLGNVGRLAARIVFWENRPVLAGLMDKIPDLLSPGSVAQYRHGLEMTIDDYRQALAEREEFRRRHAALKGRFDALISLTTPGVAPLIDNPHRPAGELPTGNPIYNVVPSLLGAPALTLPLLTMEGLPLGVQIVGQWHEDEALVALGRWLMSWNEG